MAKLYGEILSSALMTFDKSFARANGQPLDSTEIHYSLAAAQEYAAGAGAYVGQKIAVVENNIVTHYSIEDINGTLKPLGSKPVGDEKTITVAENGTVSLKGVDTLSFERDIVDENGEPTGEKETIQYQPLMTSAGLVWVEPSKTTAEGLATLIEALSGRVKTIEDNYVTEEELAAAVKVETDRATAAEEALGKRIDDISVPVAGVADGDKVLSLTDTLLSATIALGYDEENKTIKLTGKDGADLGSIDASPFIKDGMLEDVSYDADSNTLTFKWNTISGVSEDTVVLSDIIEPYTAGNGLTLAENSFAIKLADGTESFLTVSADGLKLAGVQAAIDAAKQAAIDDAASKYATIETVNGINGRVEILEAIDHTTYATKEELKATDDKAVSNTNSITNLTNRLDGIVAQGGEPNTINTIKVNGVAQTIDSEKAVNIEIPTKFTDLTDDSGFDARISAAQTQADKGVADAANAQSTAANAQSEVDALEKTVETLTTKVNGHSDSIADYLTRISVLEQADITHSNEYTALQNVVSGHTATIATLAKQTDLEATNAKVAANETAIKALQETTIPAISAEIGKKANSADVYTKTQIGTIAEGKTLVQMVEDAQAAATYNDSEIRALIGDNTTAISKNTEAIAAEVKRATEAEEAIVARLNSVANVMDFKGVLEDLPEDNTGYRKGDVIIVETVEYVFDGTEWQAFGDASATGAQIQSLQTSINVVNEQINAINNENTGILALSKSYTDTQIANLPFASSEIAGLAKVDNNTLQAADDGTLSVKKISTDLLVQGEQQIILNGGDAETPNV